MKSSQAHKSPLGRQVIGGYVGGVSLDECLRHVSSVSLRVTHEFLKVRMKVECS